jgi:hypothetical protein
MIPRREALTQLARLVGPELFIERFGSPQTTEAADEELAALIDERRPEIARGLIAEAAASDDVLDASSAGCGRSRTSSQRSNRRRCEPRSPMLRRIGRS